MTTKSLWKRITELERLMEECGSYVEAKAKDRASKYLIPAQEKHSKDLLRYCTYVLSLRFPHWSTDRCESITTEIFDMYSEYISTFNCSLILSPLIKVCRYYENFCGKLSYKAVNILFRRLRNYEAASALFDGEAIGVPKRNLHKRCSHCNLVGRSGDFHAPHNQRQGDDLRLPLPVALQSIDAFGDGVTVRKRVRKQSSDDECGM